MPEQTYRFLCGIVVYLRMKKYSQFMAKKFKEITGCKVAFFVKKWWNFSLDMLEDSKGLELEWSQDVPTSGKLSNDPILRDHLQRCPKLDTKDKSAQAEVWCSKLFWIFGLRPTTWEGV